jgi:hypothetical protein
VTGPRLKTRKYGATGHGYTLDGAKVPGVTAILGALPKQLKQWAADCAANYAVEHWAELTEQPLTKRLDAMRYAHRDVVGAAALRGTTVHRYGEDLVHGRPVEDPEYLGPAQAYARFLDRWQIEPIATETPIASTVHRYGGRPDLWATIGVRDGATALVDLKTGKNVYEDVVLQLAGYRWADLWQPDGPDSETTLEPVELVYVAHIGPDDVRMIPVDMGNPDPGHNPHYRQFLYTLQTHLWLEAHGYRGPEPLLGEAETP